MLRAFEAVAHHGSVTLAAEELSVTHGAVSHQVKALEAQLGVRLIERQGRRIALTEPGRRYAAPLQAALDGMALATEQLIQPTRRASLTIEATATFAVRWLIPRLGSFCHAHPDIDVRVATAGDVREFDHRSFDASIRCLDDAALRTLQRRRDWQEMAVHPFLDETKFPVCSPALLRARPLRKPADLRRHTLLHARSTPGAWQDWLAAARVQDLDATQGLTFDNLHFTLQAATRGLGVAIGTRPVVQEALDAGTLVQPFPGIECDPRRYYLVCPAVTDGKPAIATFRQWLLAAAHEAPGAPLAPDEA